ncbi:MAG: alanyl-tRNA editing protein [Clostridia bacterium]|nr:alanyl-tRNA editing protein [Clostridia bacterium]MBR1683698.1 alanyl-tRNA editing protein [Clostridia bacterium]MBR2287675.1 alanyl-tRNA editing protein [Clostridia bacterium]
MTQKLFEEDAFLREFTATVLSCEEKDGHFLVILDRTAFFPEGGGQPADHGTLGEAQVIDCHVSKGIITHTLTSPLTPGETVEGHIDWARRFNFMQQHSGEHIFSGLVHSTFGYNNVGFHIGSDAVTMDFDGRLTWEDVLGIEARVNEAIWLDLPVEAGYPDAQTLESLPYRSKKEIDGDIRIVRIEGYDICACCGTHVRTTGQIGQVKVVGLQNYKSGVRVSILCGVRALAWANSVLKENQEISHLTSEQFGKLAGAVEKLLHERDDYRFRLEQNAMRLFDADMRGLSGDRRMVCADYLAVSQLRPAAGLLAKACALALVLIPREGGWNYALCAQGTDVRVLSKQLQSRFSGRGGGSADMVQGILGEATADGIRAFFLAM